MPNLAHVLGEGEHRLEFLEAERDGGGGFNAKVDKLAGIKRQLCAQPRGHMHRVGINVGIVGYLERICGTAQFKRVNTNRVNTNRV